jgi:hypothetical protein
MLVTFRSTATESITMFQDVAIQLLKLMGATGKIPGALGQAGTHVTPARPADNEDAKNEDEDDEDREAPVDLATRAVPLLSILKRAAAANAEIVWEGKGK